MVGKSTDEKTLNNELWGQWAKAANKGRKGCVGRWERQADEY